MQLLNSYFKNDRLKSYIRNLKLENKGLKIEDKVDYNGIATLSLMLHSNPLIINNNLIIVDSNEIRINTDVKDIEIETILITDSR